MDISELDDPHQKNDFRRANGAPMVIIDGKNERFSRPSGWGKELDDENALVNWKLDRAIEGVAGDAAIQARAVAAKPDDRATWKDLRETAINAGRGDQGADIGTAVHAMSERWEDPDDDFHPGDPYEPHLEAYSSELQRLSLTSEYIEVKMVNPEWRAAGTCDRIYRLDADLITPEGEILPAGTLVVGDLKTGKTLDFSAPGYSVQMAIYAGGSFYDTIEDEFIETPDIHQRWGILVHLPVDRVECQMLWVDLEVGRWGAYLTQQVRQWRKNWRNGTFELHTIAPHKIEALEELGEFVESADADAEWLVEMTKYIQHRLDQIKDNGDARKRLSMLWPETIPARDLREGKVSVDQMLEAHHLIARIEADFEISFAVGAPASNGHKSEPIPTIPPSRREAEGATS